MNRITINGVVFESLNGNITIDGTTINIDGNNIPQKYSGVVEIKVLEGAIGNLNTSANVTCGDVVDVKASGSVRCNDVAGSVKADGSITCNNVGGNVSANGSVRAHDVNGNVSASGSVKYGR